MKKLLALAVLSLALVGCGPTQNEAAVANNYNFNSPTTVGRLADGRVVGRVTVAVPGSIHPHYVYFIDNATVTNNHTVQQGKTSRNDVEVEFGNY